MKSITNKMFAFFILLVIASASFAATPTNASLKGTYSFQVASSHEKSWGKQLSCSGKSVWMGGSSGRSESIVGNITFNGTGSVSGTYTDYGQFNETASNGTVTCSSNGHAVYYAPVSGTLTGTYSIQAAGTGAMSIKPSTSSTSVGFVLKVAAGNATTGLRNTVFLTGLDSGHSVDVTGSAVLQ